MTNKHTGSCLCGAVSFEIEGDFDRFFLCHCSRCRKETGSAHAANLFSSTASLTWLAGEDRVKSYRLPETRFRKCFCTECGSALPYVAGNGALLVAPAGSLDTPVEIRPEAHIFVASKGNWDDHLEEVPMFDTRPGQP